MATEFWECKDESVSQYWFEISVKFMGNLKLRQRIGNSKIKKFKSQETLKL